MPRNDAITVKVTMSEEGQVLRTRDPRVSVRPYVDAAMPLNGKVYGWDIEPYVTGSKIRQPAYAQAVAAAANDQSDSGDRQTLQIQGAHFVKLDCGYWGNY